MSNRPKLNAGAFPNETKKGYDGRMYMSTINDKGNYRWLLKTNRNKTKIDLSPERSAKSYLAGMRTIENKSPRSNLGRQSQETYSPTNRRNLRTLSPTNQKSPTQRSPRTLSPTNRRSPNQKSPRTLSPTNRRSPNQKSLSPTNQRSPRTLSPTNQRNLRSNLNQQYLKSQRNLSNFNQQYLKSLRNISNFKY